MDAAEVLARLAGIAGPPGHEAPVAAAVEELWRPLATEVRRDALGNVIAVVRGEGLPLPEGGRASVMWAAHMDEIALLVAAIEDEGFLRVDAAGGADPRNLLAQEVTVHTAGGPLAGVVGTKPPHLTSAEEARQVPRLRDLFVDVGLPPEEVRRRVRVGDPITVRQSPARLQGQRMTGKSLDNRVGVTVLTLALEELARRRHAVDVYAVATVQEEVGLRGATTSAYGLHPTLAIAVDVTFGDQPGIPDGKTVEVGKGAAVAQGANVHPRVLEALREAARAEGIATQPEPIPGASGTDAWAIQIAREGIPTGLVSVPLRHMHSPAEVVDLDDVREAARLLAAMAARLDAEAVTRLVGPGWQEVRPGAAGAAQ
ncbi:peptidase M42 family protein [Thermaerobacter marianensis DSM 12885]|uniref:Peptidase M42 family protein n=1 Tax=Thermaerobacter marianensis (strain ATCC 700841 / DSM 12885 / JCM 10246 / 7p75a) TaxID=644966 RepID=E6SHK6_THEM7|nr:M20/M25/M40 family metallo-hydrolase [Thermaerobacter marianensis]ADU51801.1 peptidase M42 family protein [Thermaerobacter marianensis DSM 12885]